VLLWLCDAGVNKTGEAVYLDFAAAIERYGKEQAYVKGLDANDSALITKLGAATVANKYGNLFQMYEKIVDEDPYVTPMMIPQFIIYGGTWVDYNLQTTIPGCFSIGESNFSDHGANRLSFCINARFSRWIFCVAIYNRLFSSRY
jgi:succinate dehydrogenase / fumarate reductase flavoprotein subunit